MGHFCKDPILQPILCTRPNTEESKLSNSAKDSIQIPVYSNSLCMTEARTQLKKKKEVNTRLLSRNFTQLRFTVHSTTLYKPVVLKDIT